MIVKCFDTETTRTSFLIATASALLAGCTDTIPGSVRTRKPSVIGICSPDGSCAIGGGGAAAPTSYSNTIGVSSAVGSSGVASYDDTSTHYGGYALDSSGTVAGQHKGTATVSTAGDVTVNGNYNVTGGPQVNVSYVSPYPTIGSTSTIGFSNANGGTLVRTIVDSAKVTGTASDSMGHSWNISISSTDGLTYSVAVSGSSSGQFQISCDSSTSQAHIRHAMSAASAQCESTIKHMAAICDNIGLLLAILSLGVPIAGPISVSFAVVGFAYGHAAGLVCR